MSNQPLIPFETTIFVRDNCLCLHAQRAARALARRFDLALKPYGLTNGQFSLLMSLNRPEPPTMRAVADVLAMDRTTLTAALKPLQRQALLEIRVNPKDLREKRIALLDAGRQRLKAALPVWLETHRLIENEMPQSDFDRLRHELLQLS